MTKKYIVQQGESWGPGGCVSCFLSRVCNNSGKTFTREGEILCPLANAKEAKEYDISCKTSWDGKPVKLFAVEEP